MEPTETDGAAATEVAPRSWFAKLRDELRTRPVTYVGVLLLTVLGPVSARMIFPEAELALVIFGGVTLGLFFGFCAFANQLFE